MVRDLSFYTNDSLYKALYSIFLSEKIEYMSIFSIDLDSFKQDFDTKMVNKEMYGEVHTDFILVNKILDLLPEHLFTDPNLKWLDPCAGRGYFPMVLYKRLFNSLHTKIKEPKKRHHHIIENMIYMIEINSDHISSLYDTFGETANIANNNFLELKKQSFDIIIGNPPFNTNGTKKVPTNSRLSKKKDGVSIWTDFLINSVDNLKDNGWIAMITPSIWLKRDHKFHNYLIDRGEIHKLHCMTNSETNRIFHNQAQTPTTFFAFNNNLSRKGKIRAYDTISTTYVSCDKLNSIPLISPSIIKKLDKFVKRLGYLNVIKTSMRPGYKGLCVYKKENKDHNFKNVTTCILNGLTPELVFNFSNKMCSYHSIQPKLILAHKMYGFPYLDTDGYGISNRDNYIIKEYTLQQLKLIRDFLTTKLAFVIFESTRYRMKYLERYAFEFIPDITKLKDFPSNINDETMADYFKFDKKEQKYIKELSKKNYLQFS